MCFFSSNMIYKKTLNCRFPVTTLLARHDNLKQKTINQEIRVKVITEAVSDKGYEFENAQSLNIKHLRIISVLLFP